MPGGPHHTQSPAVDRGPRTGVVAGRLPVIHLREEHRAVEPGGRARYGRGTAADMSEGPPVEPGSPEGGYPRPGPTGSADGFGLGVPVIYRSTGLALAIRSGVQ